MKAGCTEADLGSYNLTCFYELFNFQNIFPQTDAFNYLSIPPIGFKVVTFSELET